MFKMRTLGNSGFMTLEASVVIPVIIFIAVSIIFMFIHLYERELLRSDMYERAYSVPYENSKTDAGILQHIKGYQPGDKYLFGKASNSASCFWGQIDYSGSIEFKVKDNFNINHEVGKVTERLRRWQLYDDLAEE